MHPPHSDQGLSIEPLLNTGGGGWGFKKKLQPPFMCVKKIKPPRAHTKIQPPLEFIFYIPKFNCFSLKQPFYNIS